jgi:hypothetical protein
LRDYDNQLAAGKEPSFDADQWRDLDIDANAWRD